MKTFNRRLALAALGAALIATPALAQGAQQHAYPRRLYDYRAPTHHHAAAYSNPVGRSGSAEQYQSGAEFGLFGDY